MKQQTNTYYAIRSVERSFPTHIVRDPFSAAARFQLMELVCKHCKKIDIPYRIVDKEVIRVYRCDSVYMFASIAQ